MCPQRGVLWLLLPSLAFAGSLSPEVQLCLVQFRAGERARAEQALGTMDQIPLYRVQLDVDPKTREVNGKVQVEYPVRGRPLHELYLRATPNAVAGGRVRISNARVNGAPATLEHPEPALYEIRWDPEAPAGGSVVVDFDVSARVPRASADSASLMSAAAPGVSDHGAFSASPELIGLAGVVPMVPPTDANGAPSPGPEGFGDMALYAPANVMASVTVPSGYRVHATGEALGEVPERDGRVRFSFGAAAVRDFPILVSQGYEQATSTLDDLTLESDFAARDRAVGKKVLDYATSAAEEFQEVLGPLPYKRLKVVEAPLTGGAGGMEFPGLVTVATSLYRGAKDPLIALGGAGLAGLGPLLDSPDLKQVLNVPDLRGMFDQLLEFSVAHEVAHQYFAGLVGSDPIREPIVDESLAQYSALLYVEWKHGRAAAERIRQQQLIASYQLYRLTGGADGVADRPTGDFASGTEYAALVYGKAPLLYAEQRKVVGDEAFFKGMRAYVDQYRYRWSCSDCFTRVLARANPAGAQRLEALRRHWWLETHGDVDLGAGDLGQMVKGLTGMELDPESQQLLEQLLPQLLGH